MAKASRRKAPSKAQQRSSGRSSVRRVLALIEDVPLFDPFAEGYSRKVRTEQVSAFRRAVQPLLSEIQRMEAEHAPEAVVPPPANCLDASRAMGTPLQNLVGCPDLCSHCRSEAAASLKYIEASLRSARPKQPLFPPELTAARIQAWTQKRAVEEKRRKPRGSFKMWTEKGVPVVKWIQAGEKEPFALDTTDKKILRELVKQYPGRLIQSQIAARLGRATNSIAKNLQGLMHWELIENPRKRFGYRVTDKGLGLRL